MRYMAETTPPEAEDKQEEEVAVPRPSYDHDHDQDQDEKDRLSNEEEYKKGVAGEEEHVVIPDVNYTGMKIERAREVYSGYADLTSKPARAEVWLWYLYELCSYFIHTTLIPVLFPLFISQVKRLPPEPAGGWNTSFKGLNCGEDQMKLYVSLTHKTISVSNLRFSPLQWTSFSWAIGLVLAAPILGSLSAHLDHGRNQLLVAASAIAVGSFFCLPTGFFNVTWLFAPYIAAIVAANAVASASHTRHLGLMLRGYLAPTLDKNQFQFRIGMSGWLSLYATAAGCIGSAIIASFTYHMLGKPDKFASLWIVSIFSGLKWAIGLSHIPFIKHGLSSSSVSSIAHFFSILKYPHAFGSLIVAFLSSFTTMCLFASSVLYFIGYICFKPSFILHFWLTYFLFPVLSLPLMQPVQHFTKANGVKMHLLGFLLAILTSGVGFYFRKDVWPRENVLVFAAIQSTSAGLLHAFGRVLLIDCSPPGKEGGFSSWLSWWRGLGSFTGFAVATSIPGNVSRAFGVAFCSAMTGALLLIYGNISDVGGAIDAGIVQEENGIERRGSPVRGLDNVTTTSSSIIVLREESV